MELKLGLLFAVAVVVLVVLWAMSPAQSSRSESRSDRLEPVSARADEVARKDKARRTKAALSKKQKDGAATQVGAAQKVKIEHSESGMRTTSDPGSSADRYEEVRAELGAADRTQPFLRHDIPSSKNPAYKRGTKSGTPLRTTGHVGIRQTDDREEVSEASVIAAVKALEDPSGEADSARGTLHLWARSGGTAESNWAVAGSRTEAKFAPIERRLVAATDTTSIGPTFARIVLSVWLTGEKRPLSAVAKSVDLAEKIQTWLLELSTEDWPEGKYRVLAHAVEPEPRCLAAGAFEVVSFEGDAIVREFHAVYGGKKIGRVWPVSTTRLESVSFVFRAVCKRKTTIEFTLVRQDTEVVGRKSFDLLPGSGTTQITHVMERRWPPGTYRCTVLVEDGMRAELQFFVKPPISDLEAKNANTDPDPAPESIPESGADTDADADTDAE